MIIGGDTYKDTIKIDGPFDFKIAGNCLKIQYLCTNAEPIRVHQKLLSLQCTKKILYIYVFLKS